MPRKGFTLIEFILASMLSIIFLSLIAGAIMLILGSIGKFSSKVNSYESMRSVASRIVLDVKASNGIALQSNSSKLVLTGNASSISYDFYNNKVRRRVNSYTSYLTEPMEITSLSFSYPGNKLVWIQIGTHSSCFTLEAFVRN